MANNKVFIDIVVDDKGTTKKVALDSARLRKTLDQAADANEKYSNTQRTAYRNAQGVAQNTANTTKAFAKQAQGIGGTLVPAYATLAANAFAATAAFNALNKAAQVEQLEASLVRIGNIGGRNLRGLSESLKEISGQALSTAQALEVVATGTAQNFSSSQLKELTTIAKGASIALGRDMGDAIDRLVRGTAKLEPEILDELGIIVRLDDATRNYAASLGKTQAQLTQFERQQAFANAVTEQGIKKFGDVAASTDSTSYQKLAATFNDLSRSITDLISFALEPLVSFLASSPVALAGALAMFAGTLGKQLTPALSALAKESKEVAENASKIAAEALAATKSEYSNLKNSILGDDLEIIPSGATKELVQSLKEGTENAEKFEKGLAGVSKSAAQRKASLVKLEEELKQKMEAAKLSGEKLSKEEIKSAKEKIKLKQNELEQVEQLKVDLEELNTLRIKEGGTGGVKEGAQARSDAAALAEDLANIESEAFEKMEEARKKGMLGLIDSFKAATSASLDFFKNIGRAPGFFGKLNAGLNASKASFRLFGLAVVNAIPFIGQIIAIVSLAYEVLDSFITFPWEKNEIEKATDDIVENLKSVSDSAIQMQVSVITASSASEKALIKLKNSSGVIDQLAASFEDLVKATQKPIFEKLTESSEEFIDAMDGGWWDDLTTSVTAFFKGISFGDQRAQEISKAKTGLLEAKNSLDSVKISTESFNKVASAGLSQALAYGFSETSAVVKRYEEALKLAQERGEEGLTIKDMATLSKDLREIAERAQRFTSAIDELGQAFSAFNTDLNDFLGKETKTPFDNLAASGGRLSGVFKNIAEGIDDALAEDKDFTIEGAVKLQGDAVLKQFNELLKSPQFQQKFRVEIEAAAELDPSGLNNTAVQKIEANILNELASAQEQMILGAQEAYRGFETAVQESKERASELGKFSSNNLEIFKLQRAEQANLKNIEISRNKAVLEFLNTLGDVEGKTELIGFFEKENNALSTEASNILSDTVKQKEVELNQAKFLTDIQNKYNEAKMRELALEEKIIDVQNKRELRDIENTFGGSFIDEGRTEINQKIEKAQRELLRLQSDEQTAIDEGKKAVINAEYALLREQVKTQANLLKAEASKLKGQEKQEALAAAQALESTLSGLEKARQSSIKAVTMETDAQILAAQDLVDELNTSLNNLNIGEKIIDSIETGLQQGMTSGIADIIKGNETSLKDAILNLAKNVLEGIADVLAEEITRSIFTSLFGNNVTKAHAAGGQIVAKNISTAMSSGASQIGKEIEKLKNVDLCSCVSKYRPQQPSAEKPLMNEFDFAMRDFGIEDALSPQTTVPVTYSSESIDELINEIATGAADPEKGIFSRVKNTFSDLFGSFSSREQTSTSGRTEEGMEEVVVNGGKPATGFARLFESFTVNMGNILSGNGPFLENLKFLFTDLGTDLSSIFKTFGTNFSGILGGFSKSLGSLLSGGGSSSGLLGDLLTIGISAFAGSFGGPTGAASLEATSGFSQGVSLIGGPFRYGGISKVPEMAVGGIAKGPDAGYPAMLHGTEAVVPLPNNRSIPVDLKGAGQQNNVTVNVSVDSNGNAQQNSETNSQQGDRLGQAIAAAVQKELQNQKRSGGILNPYGVA